MPRQKVYGKRSRALYDSRAAAFSSPERPPRQNSAKQNSPTIDSAVSNSTAKASDARRIALNEKCINAVAKPTEPCEEEELTKKPPKARRKRDEDGGKETKRQSYYTAWKGYVEGTAHFDCLNEIESEIKVESNPLGAPSAKSSRDVARIYTDEYAEHCRTLLDLSAGTLASFSSWAGQITEHFKITKIAEASFGEVYRFSLLEDLPDFSRTDESVFKMIPLRPPDSILPQDKRKLNPILKKMEGMSRPSDVATEVRLLQRMRSIPGYTNFREVRVLQGRPPDPFIRAFKAFNKEQKARKKEPSHFPDPSKSSSYTADQLWAVIEMQDAGTDLERRAEDGETSSIWAVWDIFWQVVLSLAKGEEGAAFEHRDLHLGNICVRGRPETRSDPDLNRKLHFTTLETTIIDYTLSRCLMPDGSVAYHNLSDDPAVFEGDATNEYQYDIYRYMRSALFLDRPRADFSAHTAEEEASGRSWEQFHPQTNLVWLHLVLHKLLEQIDWPSSTGTAERDSQSQNTAPLEQDRWRRAKELENGLRQVQNLLDPGRIGGDGMRNTGDLVKLAVEEGWLDMEDIVGDGESECSEMLERMNALGLGEEQETDV